MTSLGSYKIKNTWKQIRASEVEDKGGNFQSEVLMMVVDLSILWGKLIKSQSIHTTGSLRLGHCRTNCMCFLDNIKPMKCKGQEVSCAERELSSALDNKIGNFKLLINGLVFSMTEIYFQKLIFIPAILWTWPLPEYSAGKAGDIIP